MNIVAARGVGRTFGSFTAVADLDLDVRAGEIVGLLGANGAGKTTLIKMLLGLLEPTWGTIRLFGVEHGLEQRRRIGYVPQNLGLYADLSQAANLEFRAAVFTGSAAAPHVAGADDTPVAHLPLGTQRRLAFEAATQHHPELLILDEPTSGVSPLARSRLWDLVHERADAGVGVLVSTHYMDEAVQADRLVVMSHGRAVASGTAAEVVGGRTIVAVDADDWGAAFAVLDDGDRRIRLAGRTIRVVGETAGVVAAVLAGVGLDASVTPTEATLDEVLIDLDAGSAPDALTARSDRA